LKNWAEIHQALLSQFSLVAEFLFGIVLVKDRESRAFKLVNFNPGIQLPNIFVFLADW
jgi:hypothetical protein